MGLGGVEILVGRYSAVTADVVSARLGFRRKVALALLAASESLLNPGKLDLAPVPLAAIFGAWLGSTISVAYMILAPLPRRVQVAVRPVAGIFIGLVPAVEIGAVAKLHGPHSVMAAGSLAGAVVGGAVIRAAIFATACVFSVQAAFAVRAAMRRRWPWAARVRFVNLAWLVVVLAGFAYDARMPEERCASLNGKVNSRAREIPGNGTDDNCRWKDAKTKPVYRDPPAAARAPPPVDVVLVTVDTLRADQVSGHGYARPTTPQHRRLREDGEALRERYTSGGWTCLAVNSMLTGLYPQHFDWEPIAITTNERIVSFPWQPKLAPGRKLDEHPVRSRETARGGDAALGSRPRRPHHRRGRVHARTMLDYGHFLEQTFDELVIVPKGTIRTSSIRLSKSSLGSAKVPSSRGFTSSNLTSRMRTTPRYKGSATP
jgi:hypothetical protein